MANNSPSKPAKAVVVLMGMTGAGKSGFGNSLLQGKDCFKTQGGLLSITHGPKSGETNWNGTHLSVVDTPGMNDAWEGQNMDRTLQHIVEGIKLTNGGADAICYVMDISKRFTKGEAEILQYLSDAGNLWPHVIVIFTHAGLVGKTTAEQETYLSGVLKHEKCPSGFKELVKNTQDRYVMFEAKERPKEYLTERINLVFTRILEVCKNTKGEKYTNALFQDVIAIFNKGSNCKSAKTQDSEDKEKKSQISSQELSNRMQTATTESMPEQEYKNSPPVTRTGKNIKETASAAGEKTLAQNVPKPPIAIEKYKTEPTPQTKDTVATITSNLEEISKMASQHDYQKKLAQNVPKPPIEKRRTEPSPHTKDAVATEKRKTEPTPRAKDAVATEKPKTEPTPQAKDAVATEKPKTEPTPQAKDAVATEKHKTEPTPQAKDAVATEKPKTEPTPQAKDAVATEKHKTEPTPQAKDAVATEKPKTEPTPQAKDAVATEKHKTEPTPQAKDAVATVTSDSEEISKMEEAKALLNEESRKLSVSLLYIYIVCMHHVRIT